MPVNTRKSRSRKEPGDTPNSFSVPSNLVPPQGDALDLSSIEHGLSFSQVDPNAYFAPDLFTDSSPIPRTRKIDADAICEAIEEKRQTLRIVRANIAHNQDAVSAGADYQKFVGNVIDFASAKVNNTTKYVGYQTARVNLGIAETKLQQAQERLTQEQIVLDGVVELTPLFREEWEQRKALKQSRIEDLRQSVYLANAKLDNEIRQLTNAVTAE